MSFSSSNKGWIQIYVWNSGTVPFTRKGKVSTTLTAQTLPQWRKWFIEETGSGAAVFLKIWPCLIVKIYWSLLQIPASKTQIIPLSRGLPGMINLGSTRCCLDQISLLKHTQKCSQFMHTVILRHTHTHTCWSDGPPVSPCLPSYRVTEAISSASSVRTEVFKTSGRTQSLLSERSTPVEKQKKTSLTCSSLV